MTCCSTQANVPLRGVSQFNRDDPLVGSARDMTPLHASHLVRLELGFANGPTYVVKYRLQKI